MLDNKIKTKRLAIVLLLGFSSGLPLALTGTLLQAWYTISGVSLMTIGALALIGQPYIYKFLWAPIFDRCVFPVFGRRRGWLFATQVGLLLAIVLMSQGNPQLHPMSLAAMGVLVAFLSASQDIAIDAYRTDILAAEERGLGSALYTGGYRVAMMVSGGLGLITAQYIGWQTTYLIMAGLMLVGLLATWVSVEPKQQFQSQPQNLAQAVIEPLREFFSRKSAWALLLIIVLYKIGDALSVSLVTPFLIRELGFSLASIGAIFKGAGLVATLLGVFVGGLIMMRMSLFRALFLFGVLQAAAILMFIQLDIVGKSYLMLTITVFVDNFCNGMGTTALVAFLMSLCDTRYTATQFALLSALASLGRVFIGPIAGVMVEHMTWVSFFVCAIAACLPGLFLLWRLRDGLISHSSLKTTTIERSQAN